MTPSPGGGVSTNGLRLQFTTNPAPVIAINRPQPRRPVGIVGIYAERSRQWDFIAASQLLWNGSPRATIRIEVRRKLKPRRSPRRDGRIGRNSGGCGVESCAGVAGTGVRDDNLRLRNPTPAINQYRPAAVANGVPPLFLR